MIYFRKVTFSKNDDAIKVVKKSECVVKQISKTDCINKCGIKFMPLIHVDIPYNSNNICRQNFMHCINSCPHKHILLEFLDK